MSPSRDTDAGTDAGGTTAIAGQAGTSPGAAAAGAGATAAANADKAVTRSFWDALYRRDWTAIATFFDKTSEYTDVPSPPDDVARGPEERLGRFAQSRGGHSGITLNRRTSRSPAPCSSCGIRRGARRPSPDRR